MRAPALVHRELEMTASLIRDLFTDDVDRGRSSTTRTRSPRSRATSRRCRPSCATACELLRRHASRSSTPTASRPQIEKTFERKVWLKKGGYICIDHAEALVAIDVNTGRFTGKKNQEETIFRTNMEAAREVPRQLRPARHRRHHRHRLHRHGDRGRTSARCSTRCARSCARIARAPRRSPSPSWA